MFSRYVCFLTLILFVSMLEKEAFAQKEEEKQGQVVYQKKTTIDFSDAAILGHQMGPDGVYVKKIQKPKFGRLIELRSNFRAELKKSEGDL